MPDGMPSPPAVILRGKRVVVYVRVSSTFGREDTFISDAVQRRACQDFAARHGLDVVAVVTDLNLSGRTSSNRQIGSIVRMVEEGSSDGVLVWKINRWGRDLMDSLKNVMDLQNAGGFIRSATEDLDAIETGEGSFTLTELLAVAQLQSEQISQTWKDVRSYRIDQGLPAAGGERFGYTYRPSRGRHDLGGYEVHVQDGPTLRDLYLKYIDGVNWPSLVQHCRDVGAQTKGRGSGKPPRDFSIYSLTRVLDSGFGAGKIVLGTSQHPYGVDGLDYRPGSHRAVITETEWHAYLERRGRKAPRPVVGPIYAVSGLVRCSTCQARMFRNNAHLRRSNGEVVRRPYLVCQHHPRMMKSVICESRTRIRMSVVEEAVELFADEWSDRVLSVATEQSHPGSATAADLVRDAQNDLHRARARLQSLSDGGPSNALFLDRKTRLMIEEQAVEDIARLDDQIALLIKAVSAANSYADLLREVSAGWTGELSAAELNSKLTQVIDRIDILPTVSKKRPTRAEALRRVRIVPMWTVSGGAVGPVPA